MLAALKDWFRRSRERRQKLYALYAESRRLEHRLYELRCTGEYLGEPSNQERAGITPREVWASYEAELAATRKAVRDNDAEIEKVRGY